MVVVLTLRLNPELAAAYCNQGLAHSNKGQHENAINLGPKLIVDYNNCGVVAQRQETITARLMIISIDSHYAAVHENRGKAHRAIGEDDRAESGLGRVGHNMSCPS